MTGFQRFAWVALFAALGACATGSGGAGPDSTADEVQSVSLGEGEQTLGRVAEANIPLEQCGMILWTLEAQRPVPVFRFISGKEGSIVLGLRPVSLDLQSFSGASDFGVFENQLFRSDDGLEVEITARFGVGFSGGAYLESGLIKVRDPSGWSVITPAAGIAGCR